MFEPSSGSGASKITLLGRRFPNGFMTRPRMWGDQNVEDNTRREVSIVRGQGNNKMCLEYKNFLEHFGFSHDRPELFRVGQWGNTRTLSRWFLCYRVILAMSYTTTYITLWILDTTELKSTWLIYLTNQSMLLLVTHLMLEMALAIKAFISQKNGHSLR